MRTTKQAIEAGFAFETIDGEDCGVWSFRFGDGYQLSMEPMILGQICVALYQNDALLTEKVPVLPYREGLPPDSGMTSLIRALAADMADWPQGHPCRDCGAFYHEHPHAVAGCETWR